MDVKKIATTLGITNTNVIRKAEEFMRLTKIRCPVGIGAAESCKPAACLGLACRLLGEDFDKGAAVKASGSAEKIYQHAYVSLQNILNVRPELTAHQLSVHFGAGLRLSDATESTLKKYKASFLKGLSSHEQLHADFSNTVFIAVAFYLTAQSLKMKIDKKKLLNFADMSSADFLKVSSSMGELCFGKALGSSGTKTAKLNDALTEKRKREEDEELSDLEGEKLADDIKEEEIPGLKKSKKRVKREQHEEWKDQVLSAPKSTVIAGPLKQASLFNYFDKQKAESPSHKTTQDGENTPKEPPKRKTTKSNRTSKPKK